MNQVTTNNRGLDSVIQYILSRLFLMTYAIWIQSINVKGLGSFWSLLLVSGECVLLEEMAARDTFLILNQKTANQNN